MCRLLRLLFCLCLGVSGAPALASAGDPDTGLCRSVAFRTLNDLCEAVMRIFPIRESQKPVAKEPEIVRPLDLTLPPELGQDDNALLDPQKPLLPPLFGLQPRPGAMSLGGRLITNEQDTPFELDLSNMIDRIEGAELQIQIRQ